MSPGERVVAIGQVFGIVVYELYVFITKRQNRLLQPISLQHRPKIMGILKGENPNFF